MRGVDAGNPICGSVTRPGSRIHSHARTTCTMSAGIRSSLSRYGWPTTRNVAVSLCAIDRGGREGGARERRRGPALLSIRGNAVSVVAGCFFDLSLSLSLSLSLDLLIIDWSMDSSWRKREFALLLVDNNGWQQWIEGSVSGIRGIGWHRRWRRWRGEGKCVRKRVDSLLYVINICSIRWSWSISSLFGNELNLGRVKKNIL